MTILVGYPSTGGPRRCSAWPACSARSSGEDLLVCTVIPAPWMPGLSRADEGYRSYIEESTEVAVAQARGDLPSDVSAKFTTVYARSAPSGMLEAAEQHEGQHDRGGVGLGGPVRVHRLE